MDSEDRLVVFDELEEARLAAVLRELDELALSRESKGNILEKMGFIFDESKLSNNGILNFLRKKLCHLI